MTRRTIYRIALATLMLPNFTAYWWLLPKRMKRFRTERQVVEWRVWQRSVRTLFDEYVRFHALMDLICNQQAEMARIGERDFRLPF